MGNDTSKTSLTKRDLEAVQSSWKVVMENPEQNGIVIFKTFLTKHDYFSYFKKFAQVPRDELEDNPMFRSHAGKIIQALDTVIASLDDEDAIRNKLTGLGKMHAKNNITEEQFQQLKEVILEVLETAFQVPEEGIEAWRKTLDHAFVFIFEGLGA